MAAPAAAADVETFAFQAEINQLLSLIINTLDRLVSFLLLSSRHGVAMLISVTAEYAAVLVFVSCFQKHL